MFSTRFPGATASAQRGVTERRRHQSRPAQNRKTQAQAAQEGKTSRGRRTERLGGRLTNREEEIKMPMKGLGNQVRTSENQAGGQRNQATRQGSPTGGRGNQAAGEGNQAAGLGSQPGRRKARSSRGHFAHLSCAGLLCHPLPSLSLSPGWGGSKGPFPGGLRLLSSVETPARTSSSSSSINSSSSSPSLAGLWGSGGGGQPQDPQLGAAHSPHRDLPRGPLRPEVGLSLRFLPLP